MRRTAKYLALSTAFLLAATACSGINPEGGDGGELVFATGAAIRDVHEQVLALWNEQNPDTPVRGEWLPDDADGQRQQMSLELNAGGSGMDILALDVMWTGEFAENGWIESMEDLRSDLEGAVLAGPLESAEYQGELWAVPYNSNAGLLYYRTDLIDEPPTTWEELKEVGLAAAEEAGIGAYVGQGAQYEGMVVSYLEYLWGAGGELFDEQLSEVRFEDEHAMTALEFMRGALEDGLYAPGYNTMQEEEARNEFQRGNAVFMRNWPYAYELLLEEGESEVADRFDVAPLPTFTGDGTTSALGGNNLAVSAYTDNPEGAREFVRFIATDEEVQRILARNAVPPVAEAVYEELSEDRVFEVLAEVLAEARPRPPIPEWNDISVTMQQELFPAYNGDGDPQRAIDAVRDHLESVVSR
jgi:multiple sugar transport system substrate-binding protein